MAMPPFSSSTPKATITLSGKVKQSVFNIRDYGAVGDGTTDDTAALNAAISAADAAGGGKVFVPSGIYAIAGTTTALPGGVWLMGTGYDFHTPTSGDRPSRMSVLRCTAAMSRLIQLSPTGTGTSSASGNTGASIFHMVLDGNGLATDTVKTAGRRNRIVESEIYSGATNTINVAGQNTTIQGCMVSGEGVGDVIKVGAFSDHKILDNQIMASGSTGTNACINISVSSVLVRGNHMWEGANGVSAAGFIIYISGSVTLISIVDNIVDGTQSDQIRINSTGGTARNITITGNTFFISSATTLTDNTASALTLYGSGNVNQLVFSSNTVDGIDATHRYAAMVNSVSGGTRNRVVVSANVGNMVVLPFTGFTPASHYGNIVWNGSATVQGNNKGTTTTNGDGSTVAFTIAHGLSATPTTWNVTPASLDASGSFYVTASSTNLTVTYATAPASGTNNVILKWKAEI